MTKVFNRVDVEALKSPRVKTTPENVEEANQAFKWNMAIFQELEGNLIAAIGKVLFAFLTRSQRRGSTEVRS